MSNRKKYLIIMNKLLKAYKDEKNNNGLIGKDEYSLINEMISIGYLNDKAFAVYNSVNAEITRLDFNGKYPLTTQGKDYYDMGWYHSVKQSGAYQLIRDIAAFIGAIAGITIAALSLFKK